MLRMRFENLFEKMLFVLSLSILIQLMFTIGASHQNPIESGKQQLTPLYNEFNQNVYQPQDEEEEEDKPNRLTLSNNLLNYLMKVCNRLYLLNYIRLKDSNRYFFLFLILSGNL